MRGNILILCEDAIFARMLELELSMAQHSVRVNANPKTERADLILVDLDTAPIPASVGEGTQIVGFTRRFDVSQLDAGRRCSMILHRPFEMRILREEIALMNPSTVSTEQSTLSKKDVTPKLVGNTLTLGDQTLTLRPKEAAVLSVLLANRPNAVSREEIARHIGESTANKADVYVCYLRRRIATLTERPMIKTVRGKGYRID